MDEKAARPFCVAFAFEKRPPERTFLKGRSFSCAARLAFSYGFSR
jgi:hypothetical protein